MFKAIAHWWTRPPAQERILAALSPHEWRRPLDVIKRAEVSIGGFYSRVIEMEARGLVVSKWEDRPPSRARGGRRRRVYKRQPTTT